MLGSHVNIFFDVLDTLLTEDEPPAPAPARRS